MLGGNTGHCSKQREKERGRLVAEAFKIGKKKGSVFLGLPPGLLIYTRTGSNKKKINKILKFFSRFYEIIYFSYIYGSI